MRNDGQRHLDPDMDAAVRAELRSGERLVWVGRPDPRRALRGSLGATVFGLFFAGFATFWIAGAAAGVWFSNTTAPADGAPAQPIAKLFLLFPCFGLPFLAIGLWLASTPLWAMRRARRTVCCVTDQRAFEVHLGRARTTKSWAPDDLGTVEKTVYADGRGTVFFATERVQGSKGRVRTVQQGFVGVDDPNGCEQAIVSLVATRSSGDEPGPQRAQDV
jgi:hypothetical protein